MFLGFFVSQSPGSGWIASSLQTAKAYQLGPATAKSLRSWTRAFIADRHALPSTAARPWQLSLLERRPDLRTAIEEHLQSVGKYVRAMNIVHFMSEPAVLAQYGLTKPVALSTAQVWMHALEYRWTKVPSGQYVDGHKRADVVSYRQDRFLPAMAWTDSCARMWDKDGTESPLPHPPTGTRRVVYWFHDESVFYANDRRKTRWVHKSEKAVPRTKGEGASLMAADFVSADYGWLRSPDGKESTRVRPEKNRDGYFTHEEILAQATAAMDILARHYPDEDHVLIFDNATTHLKRAADALSARHMSMKPTQDDKPMFGVETPLRGPDGKPVYGPDGKVLKTKIRMEDARFKDGSPQSLYFPAGHPREGVFKGMIIILQERGFANVNTLRAQCPAFKCLPPALDCCCRRLLFNQPDFRDVESLLETHCKARGFTVLFLPKFHCELNCIEQCWGYAKRVYRKLPASSAEADLERNVSSSLDSVPLDAIFRFYTCSHRFMDAYWRGLNGTQAAWAAKKYRSHRVLPGDILDELDRADIS
ncbi:uncharacterized protein TRAVEDRAFT_115102 [Trametes versicolor FP-101664 SS1]|uniref:uncharacterized protein n=1 Tax=Trametes versicolor (strain FP-101664) TaxID=717944 RepID=UPI000462156C|nr:uncharacterized protein TRAVEDRAFT_115102 [Trametes versicolor FP-101664 SS1]EIW62921.1 hypothetical protein TRAVEDRAFT_115102 [Trametes versicolor FP-101664 SS1]